MSNQRFPVILLALSISILLTGCDSEKIAKKAEKIGENIQESIPEVKTIVKSVKKIIKNEAKKESEEKNKDTSNKKPDEEKVEKADDSPNTVIVKPGDEEEIEVTPNKTRVNTRPPRTPRPAGIASATRSAGSPKSPEYSNYESLDATKKSKISLTRGRGRESGTINITSRTPFDHTTGLVMQTTPLGKRAGNPNSVSKFYLDKGIYSSWRFKGSKGSDILHFGPQGAIINKRSGGVVDFGVDNAKDVFIFENRINLERKPDHHPLNHLQKVVIRNFGKEDELIIQGKKYGYKDIKNNLLPIAGPDRLQIFTIP